MLEGKGDAINVMSYVSSWRELYMVKNLPTKIVCDGKAVAV